MEMAAVLAHFSAGQLELAAQTIKLGAVAVGIDDVEPILSCLKKRAIELKQEGEIRLLL